MNANNKRYSLTNIRKGIHYFLFGKAFTVVSGLLYLVLVVRYLSVNEYAAYVTFFAFVTILSMISAFGVPQVVLRFTPELYASGKDKFLRKFLWTSFTIRFLSLLFFILVVYIFSPEVAEVFQFSGYLFEFKLYLCVVFLRVLSLFLFRFLESLLKQKIAQIGIGVSSLLKVLFFFIVIYSVDAISLFDVVVIEIISDLVALLLLSYWNVLFFRTLQSTSVEHEEIDSDEKREFITRIVSYAKVQYIQHTIISLYGSAPNKLIASYFLTSFNIGLFGFAQALSNFAKRFLPLQLLIGIVRPVFTARYSVSNDFSELVVFSNVIYKINFILLVLVMSIVYTSGDEIFLLITDGKFGHMVTTIFLVFLFNLIIHSAILSLDILLQIVEKTKIMIYSNLLLSFSTVISLLLISKIGVLILPLANMLGLIFSLFLVLWWLKHCGYDFRFDVYPLSKIALSGLLSVTLPMLFDSSLWILNIFLTFMFFLAFNLIFKSFNQNDIDLIKKLVWARRERNK